MRSSSNPSPLMTMPATLLPASLHGMDTTGLLFQNDRCLYRRLGNDAMGFFTSLASNGVLGRLMERGLVRTEISSEEQGSLEHQKVPFVSCWQEWTAPMLKEAALLVLRLARELTENGLHLHDAHTFNVTFYHGKPVFLDAGSIRPGAGLDRQWAEEFYWSFYIPLWASKVGPFRTMRELVAASAVGGETALQYDHNHIRKVLGRRKLGRVSSYWRAARKLRSPRDKATEAARFLDWAIERIDGWNVSLPEGEWSDYRSDAGEIGRPETYRGKGKGVHMMLEPLPPGRLADLGCSDGWMTELAASMGHTCVGVEFDAVTTERARQRGIRTGFDVARANLLAPTPPQGRMLAIDAMFKRFSADTVLLIAMMHHLCVRQRLSFAGLADMVLRYGARAVVLDWIPPTDPHLVAWEKEHPGTVPAWYTYENLIKAFADSGFKVVRKHVCGIDGKPINPVDDRTVMLLVR